MNLDQTSTTSKARGLRNLGQRSISILHAAKKVRKNENIVELEIHLDDTFCRGLTSAKALGVTVMLFEFLI